MAAIQDGSNIEKKSSSFKPQYLDKIVLFMQFSGVAHNSKSLCNLKAILLLCYNITVLIMTIMALIQLIIPSIFNPPAYFHEYLQLFNRLIYRTLNIVIIWLQLEMFRKGNKMFKVNI